MLNSFFVVRIGITDILTMQSLLKQGVTDLSREMDEVNLDDGLLALFVESGQQLPFKCGIQKSHYRMM